MSISSYSDSLSSFSFNSDEFSASREKDPSSESLSWEESESSSGYDSELSDQSTSKTESVSTELLNREIRDKLRPSRIIKNPIIFDEIVDTSKKSQNVAKETFFHTFEKAIGLFDTPPQEDVRFLEALVNDKNENDPVKLGMAWSLLGNAYQEGIGSKQDLDLAEKAYLRAYKFGVVVSEYHLGTIYETKGFHKENPDSAKYYYKNYIKKGGWAGHYKMGMLLLNEGKTKQANRHFQACIQGSENEKDSTILDDFEDHVLESKRQLQNILSPSPPLSDSFESDQYGNEKATTPAVETAHEEILEIGVIPNSKKTSCKTPKTLKRRQEDPANQQLPPKKRKLNATASSLSNPIYIAEETSEEQEIRLGKPRN